MKLKKLPKKITNEIRAILEGCRDGRLQHNQADWTCGTSRCIAGWKASMDFVKTLPKKERQSRLLGGFYFDPDFDEFTDDGGFLEYAQRAWELTDHEANELFNGGATFPEQFALLEKLEAGERLV